MLKVDHTNRTIGMRGRALLKKSVPQHNVSLFVDSNIRRSWAVYHNLERIKNCYCTDEKHEVGSYWSDWVGHNGQSRWLIFKVLERKSGKDSPDSKYESILGQYLWTS